MLPGKMRTATPNSRHPGAKSARSHEACVALGERRAGCGGASDARASAGEARRGLRASAAPAASAHRRRRRAAARPTPPDTTSRPGALACDYLLLVTDRRPPELITLYDPNRTFST
ncbi:unnamed protein product [Euphydryas editha]|uniref:Uncharacterized protein n=1 Tax=Euphydryas editha TaxID=104508 RepID=A0AAU9TKC9_EUPED|nr:unnamed protein product [Euphydryas editha]